MPQSGVPLYLLCHVNMWARTGQTWQGNIRLASHQSRQQKYITCALSGKGLRLIKLHYKQNLKFNWSDITDLNMHYLSNNKLDH